MVVKKLKTVSLVVDDLLDCDCRESLLAFEIVMSDPSNYTAFMRYIRNNYGLWEENEELAKDCLKVNPVMATETFRMRKGEQTEGFLLGEVHPDDASSVIFDELKKRFECDECGCIKRWHRVTQFAGTHEFCDSCAKKQDDFGEDDSYKFWVDLKDES